MKDPANLQIQVGLHRLVHHIANRLGQKSRFFLTFASSYESEIRFILRH